MAKRRALKTDTGEEERTYTDKQLAVVAAHIAGLHSREWFATTSLRGTFDKSEEPFLVRLVVALFLCWQEGSLPTKKQAMKYMRAVDARTSQRYIQFAQNHGLLTVTQSNIDRRIDLLCPTELLIQIVRYELAVLADDARFALEAMMFDGDLPETKAPQFRQTSFPERDSNRFTWSIETGGLLADRHIPIDRVRLGPKYDWKYQIAQLSETIQFAPPSAEAYYQRGSAYLLTREYDKALADTNESIRLGAGTQAYMLRAMIQESLGALAEAHADYGEAIRLRPKDLHIYDLRARLAMEKMHDARRAIEDLDVAVKLVDRRLHGPFASLHASRARAYAALGDRERAIMDLKEAMRLDPVGYTQADMEKLLSVLSSQENAAGKTGG